LYVGHAFVRKLRQATHIPLHKIKMQTLQC